MHVFIYIYQDTVIIPATEAVNNDKSVFNNPDEFRPEHFLDDSGNLKNMDKIFPFGVGTQTWSLISLCLGFTIVIKYNHQTALMFTGGRRCPGQPVAEVITFIFMATILKSYTVTILSNEPKPTTKLQIGITMRPFPYKVLVKPRQI